MVSRGPKFPFLPGASSDQDLLWRQCLAKESAGQLMSENSPAPIVVSEPSHANEWNGTAAARALQREAWYQAAGGNSPSTAQPMTWRTAQRRALGSSVPGATTVEGPSPTRRGASGGKECDKSPARGGGKPSHHSRDRRELLAGRTGGSARSAHSGRSGRSDRSGSSGRSGRSSRGDSSRRAALQLLCSSIQQEAAHLRELSLSQVSSLRKEMEAETRRRRQAEESLDRLTAQLKQHPWGQTDKLKELLRARSEPPGQN